MFAFKPTHLEYALQPWPAVGHNHRANRATVRLHELNPEVEMGDLHLESRDGLLEVFEARHFFRKLSKKGLKKPGVKKEPRV